MKLCVLLLLCRIGEVVSLFHGKALLSPSTGDRRDISNDKCVDALDGILQTTAGPKCSVILLFDGNVAIDIFAKIFLLENNSLGSSVFYVDDADGGSNFTLTQLSSVVLSARKMRQAAWCVTIVAVSNSLEFIETLTTVSLEERLLVWSARLLLITNSPLQTLKNIVAGQWIFTMMNSMVLHQATEFSREERCGLFVYQPFSEGGPQLLRVASWKAKDRFIPGKHHSLFPNKFSNFQGHPVGVTALPFPPYWKTIEKISDGSIMKTYSGTDYLMLEAISSALNFTINVLHTDDWDEVTKKVEARESFMATVIYAVLPHRLQQYDFSYAYEFGSPTFCMKKPDLKPQWLSLYYPLTNEVWAASFTALLLVPVIFIMLDRLFRLAPSEERIQFSTAMLKHVGILLSQPAEDRGDVNGSIRVLFCTWLFFSFIIGTVYRGNLTAYLTLPKYPPRAETLEELVKTVDRVTMPPYGEQFRIFFSKSDSKVFQTLASIWGTAPSVRDGLKDASKKREAHIENRRFLELAIAEEFTNADGSTDLYLGRESLFPGISAWPMPHDAPYKPNFDRCIMAIVEAGLYEKWSQDMMEEARKASRENRLKNLKEERSAEENHEGVTAANQALTIVHMQGAFMLLMLGLALATKVFMIEIIIWSLSSR